MQIENELNEILLEAYEAGYKTGTKENLLPFRVWYEQNESKILALGKPEPLAKNKQTQEFKCNYCKDHGFILMVPLHGDYMTTKADCPYCTKRADATSR